MDKRVWNAILLCLIIVCFVFSACLCVQIGASTYEMLVVGIEVPDDALPLAPFFVELVTLTSIIVESGLVFGISSVGLLLSLLCRTKSDANIVSKISFAFVFIFAAMMIFIYCVAIIFVIAIIKS